MLTVGDLRRVIAGLDDALPVYVEAEAFVDNDIDTLHASGTGASFEKADSPGIFSGPPVDRLVISADGVPSGTCRECGGDREEHRRFCDEATTAEETDRG